MTIEEALSILDSVLGQVTLNDIQELVFRHAWEDWTYEQMAAQFGYTTDYVRNVGSQLWASLSVLLGVRVSKKNVQSVVRRWAQQHQSLATQADTPRLVRSSRQDLGEAPDVVSFSGRVEELAILTRWVVGDARGENIPTSPCRLVALLGMGGMGKTSLAAKLARQVESQFDAVVWRSLRHAPPLEELLAGLIQFLSDGAETDATLPSDRASRITQLIHHLRQQRCLMILDNAESVLPCHGLNHQDDNGYTELLESLSDLAHDSCVVLTSREKPDAIALKEGLLLPVRSLQLSGLSSLEAKAIFAAKGEFWGSDADWQRLIQHYAGNPLALKMVAAAIQDLFHSNLSEFLTVLGSLVFDDIQDLLDRQFNRLSTVEKEVMYWLAINREVTSFTQLRDDFLCPIARQTLPSVLRSLKHRFLVETTTAGFTQQPVVMEYVTQRLIEHVSQEILSQGTGAPGSIGVLQTHALLKATAKDYIRDIQTRLILAPLVERLQARLRSRLTVEEQLRILLADFWFTPESLPGYAVGNGINLLCYLGANLTGLDLSNLTIRQAQLQDIELHEVNLTNAEVRQSTFLDSLSSVWAVAFNPDGSLLAASDAAGTIHIWRVADYQKVMTLKGHTNWICAIAFSPDGKWLASGSAGNVVKWWDLATGQCLNTFYGHTEWVLSVAFHPTGTCLASSSADRTIKFWHPLTGNCIKTLDGHTHWVGAIAFSPDGQQLASGSDDGTIKLWDGHTGTCLQTLSGHSSHVRTVAFSPDGQQLASGSSDRTVKIWDLATGTGVHTLTGHSQAVRAVTYFPTLADDTNFHLISASEDGSLRVWATQSGQCLKRLPGHSGHIRSVAVHPNGHLIASGSADQTVKLWSYPTGHCLSTLRGYTNFVLSVACGGAGTDQTSTGWIASGHSDRTIRLWNLHTGDYLQSFKGHTHDVWGVTLIPPASPHGQPPLLASCSTDQTIRLWNVQTGQCLKVLRGHTDWIHAIAASADGSLLASASSDQTIRLWDVQTGHCRSILRGHDSHIWSVAFSPVEPLLASSSDDHTIKLWDLASGECLQTFTGHSRRVQAIAFSPDGRWLASSSSDQTIAVWDVPTGRCLRTLQNQGDHIRAIAFSPFQSPFFQQTGQLLLCSYAETTAKLWNAHTGELLHELHGHTSRIWAIAFSPDGQTLITGSEDGTLRLWDAEQGKELTMLQSPRPYEGMTITGIHGLTDAQKSTLKSLGAIDE
ncbi:MAG: NB-ARC domain-containing protein [Leptolyngbyaceae cyanobacterium bins.349]|nr:NB-ARC domain-containing protein [Leptolyngbyaceae cyanobacterium bins.349]